MDDRTIGTERIKSCLRKISGIDGFYHFNIEVRGQEEALLYVRKSADHVIDISTLDVVEKGHAPAKPVTEISNADCTVFEIGMYKTYGRPMVWCRDKGKTTKFNFINVPNWSAVGGSYQYARSSFDYPLYSQCCIDWNMSPKNVSLCDIIEETILTALSPPPDNCWAVDFSSDFLTSIVTHPCIENLAATAALISFLHLIPSCEFIVRDVVQLHHLYSEGMRLLVSDMKKQKRLA